MVESHHSAEKGPVWRESGVTTQGRDVEVGNLLLGDDKNNVIADKVLSVSAPHLKYMLHISGLNNSY